MVEAHEKRGQRALLAMAFASAILGGAVAGKAANGWFQGESLHSFCKFPRAAGNPPQCRGQE